MILRLGFLRRFFSILEDSCGFFSILEDSREFLGIFEEVLGDS